MTVGIAQAGEDEGNVREGGVFEDEPLFVQESIFYDRHKHGVLSCRHQLL